ncbi:hypothetical protein [Trichococcus collinsii]|nr:hypothetical protein [Trichococcus collinsii]
MSEDAKSLKLIARRRDDLCAVGEGLPGASVCASESGCGYDEVNGQ